MSDSPIPQQAHRPNHAAMKGPEALPLQPTPNPAHAQHLQAAAQPEPQRRPESYLSSRDPITDQQLVDASKAVGRWTEQNGQNFQQHQARLTPAQAAQINARETDELRKYVTEQRAQTMQPDEIVRIYRSVGNEQQAKEFPDNLKQRQAISDEAGEKYRIDSAKQAIRLQERFGRMPPAQQLENIARQQNQPYTMTAEKQREIERSYAKAPEPVRDSGRAARDARVQAAQQAINAEALTRKIDHEHTRGPKR